jgi:hypothetical protein
MTVSARSRKDSERSKGESKRLLAIDCRPPGASGHDDLEATADELKRHDHSHRISAVRRGVEAALARDVALCTPAAREQNQRPAV